MTATGIIVASWTKNARETFVVKLDDFKGQPIVDIRAWYPSTDGNLMPGRSGLTTSVRHLPALADAIAKARDMAGSPLPEGWDGPQDS